MHTYALPTKNPAHIYTQVSYHRISVSALLCKIYCPKYSFTYEGSQICGKEQQTFADFQ